MHVYHVIVNPKINLINAHIVAMQLYWATSGPTGHIYKQILFSPPLYKCSQFILIKGQRGFQGFRNLLLTLDFRIV